ncbi:hypothetical protein Goarm_009947 [Gossypium armourianum]|uniref:RNase H type-1 domain-containing protein n=1 Tax=Gossypium armourianum TaxID=34283 RepID=A0A7J9JUK6_9ROSI|nr:hypothetical protein [Gossypium armourianum]
MSGHTLSGCRDEAMISKGRSKGDVKGRKIETRALYEGLKLAWARGCHCVEVDCDNAILVKIIGKGLVADNSIPELCMESNSVVDFLAKSVMVNLDQYQIFFNHITGVL